MLREFPDHGPKEEEPRLITADFLIWGDGTGSEGIANWLEFSGQSTREERTSQKENYRDLQRVLFKYSGKYYCLVHAYEETT